MSSKRSELARQKGVRLVFHTCRHQVQLKGIQEQRAVGVADSRLEGGVTDRYGKFDSLY